MGRWSPPVSPTAARRIVGGLGGLYVLFVAGEFLGGLAADQSLVQALIDVPLIGGAGIALLLASSRLPRSGLHPSVYPRIAGWCLGGCAVMLGVVGLLAVNPAGTIDNPVRAAVLAMAFGSGAGLGIGLNEARAFTRAYEAEAARHEAERNERRLQREKARLGSFAGMLAHELRNPLNIAQIYSTQAHEGDDAAAEQVEQAHTRIEEMIDVLLIMARSREATIDRETVAIADVATDVWDHLSPGEADLIVETDREIRVDPVHFQHLLKNLFSNAIEHGREDVTVRVGDHDGGFYVADDGPGVPEDRREAVFEPGYSSKADGIGLGLTFVGHLVEMYDWDCTIVDSEDGGMRFECRDLDLAREDRPASTDAR